MTTATRFTTSGSWYPDLEHSSGERFQDSMERSHGPLRNPDRTARGLGWFSLGLGLAQVAAPGRVARLIGVNYDDTNVNTMFAIGVREIASGLGILAGRQTAGSVWSRVGGDVMDLALLGRAMSSDRSEKGRVAAAAAAVAGVTFLDVLTGQALSREGTAAGGNGGQASRPDLAKGIDVKRAITVGAPRDEVYRFWRDFANLPRFMQHLESVQVLDDRRSHWKAKAPAGTSVEWDAEVIDDQPE